MLRNSEFNQRRIKLFIQFPFKLNLFKCCVRSNSEIKSNELADYSDQQTTRLTCLPPGYALYSSSNSSLASVESISAIFTVGPEQSQSCQILSVNKDADVDKQINDENNKSQIENNINLETSNEIKLSEEAQQETNNECKKNEIDNSDKN